jgi:drug/metabolite transporter (DMT)-like permease
VKPLLGILLKLISALAFTVMAAEMKIVSARYPIGEIVFFRSLFALVPAPRLARLAAPPHRLHPNPQPEGTPRARRHRLLRHVLGICGAEPAAAA